MKIDIGLAQRVAAAKPWHTPRGFRNLPGMVPRTMPPGTYAKFMRERNALRNAGIVIPDGHVIPAAEALRALHALQDADTLTWIGHATFLLRLGKTTLLTDPFLSERASPFSFLGPRRIVPPGISVRNLPPIDVVIVSHNHYDHLDLQTLRALPNRKRITALVPLGLGHYLTRLGYGRVIELDWYEAATVGGVTITALPAQHWSQRGLFDANRSLWMGAAIDGAGRRLYFAGDCGYGPTFAETGRRYGPFDLGLVGIGAYEPRAMMRSGHTNPEEAVALARDMGAQAVGAMHWGTICLGTEPPFEAPGRFSAAAQAAGYAAADTHVYRIGETRTL